VPIFRRKIDAFGKGIFDQKKAGICASL